MQEPAGQAEPNVQQSERIVINPPAGPVEGGVVVTIVGTGFAQGTSVQFGAYAALDLVVVNSQLMIATTPPGDPGLVDVILRFPPVGGQAARVLRLPEAFHYYILPPDDGTDSDADGLTDYQELLGWSVWVDWYGLGLGSDTFGNIYIYTCISDPANPDTDEDGIGDMEEYLVRCDARLADTDGDGLTDHEELKRWLTSPISVDTDGDSRGVDATRAPNAALFDGAELKTVGFASPSTPFISEYVEGTDSNRAIEIFNPGEQNLSLDDGSYTLRILEQDGRTSRIPLTGNVPAGETFVVVDPGAEPDLMARAQEIIPLPFDGDDVVVLERGDGEILDVVDAPPVGEEVDQESPFGGSTCAIAGTALDQEVPITGGREKVLSSPAWQTFMPAITGEIRYIDVLIYNTGTEPIGASLTVFEGSQPLEGQEIGAFVAVLEPGDFNYKRFHATGSFIQRAEQVYTWQVELDSYGPTLRIWEQETNPYPRGGEHDSSMLDLTFNTYARPAAYQTFTPQRAERVSAVTLWMARSGADRTARLRLIEGDQPDGAPLATLTAAEVDGGAEGGVRFTPDTDIHLEPGVVHTWLLESFDVADDEWGLRCRTDNPYSGGQAQDDAGTDYVFNTQVAVGKQGLEDQTLRRKRVVCAGRRDGGEAADVHSDWEVFAADTFDGVGSHTAICLPTRIIAGGTSPTLADTDGDGTTDYDEFDEPFRTPVVADLPQLAVHVEGDIDVLLNIEFADSQGASEEFGTTLGTENTTSSAWENSRAESHNWRVQFGVGAEVAVGTETGSKVTVSSESEYSGGIETTTTISGESSTTSSEELSRVESVSRDRTQTAASGTISAGLRIRNTGIITVTLTNLAMTIKQSVPPQAGDAEGSYRVITTLLPDVQSVTLAPGEESSLIRLSREDVNAQRIKELMASPQTLKFEAAAFALEDEDGRDWDFVRETTFARTAMVLIDYGDSRTESHFVATNVDRVTGDPRFPGIRLEDALESVLGMTLETVSWDPGDESIPNTTVIRRLNGVPEGGLSPRGFWSVVHLTRGQEAMRPLRDVNVEDIRLRAGDEVLIHFTRDDDADGLTAAVERVIHTSDTDLDQDSDGDGLTDPFEHLDGWEVQLIGAASPYAVRSRPAATDTDADGLSDSAEYFGGDGFPPENPQDTGDATDPAKADTDGDGLRDDVDPEPLAAARVLYVRAAADLGGDGTSWASAFRHLQDALFAAADANSNSAVPDVSQIWVARGVYRPDQAERSGTYDRFELVPNLSIYGGFTGTESSLRDRNPDPLTNGTVLSADVNGDDRDIFSGDPKREDNLPYVVASFTDATGYRVDGFTVQGAAQTGAFLTGRGAMDNLVITQNSSGLGFFYYNTQGALEGHRILFARNGDFEDADARAAFIYRDVPVTFTDCVFQQNVNVRGGAGIVCNGGSLTLDRCRFVENTVLGDPGLDGDECQQGTSHGAAILLAPGHGPAQATLRHCSFVRNRAQLPSIRDVHVWNDGDVPESQYVEQFSRVGGGAIAVQDSIAALFGCEFFENSAVVGAGVYANPNSRLVVTNCTFVANENLTLADCHNSGPTSRFPGAGIFTHGLTRGEFGDLTAANSLFFANIGLDGADPPEGEPAYDQVYTSLEGTLTPIEFLGSVRNSFVGNLDDFINSNLGGPDPMLADWGRGDMRLTAESPCIDRGDPAVDVDPFTPGFDGLPPADIRGLGRVVDGDGDEIAQVDMGAHEYQPR